MIDQLLLVILKMRLRRKADFYSEVGRAVLDHVARKKEAETEARDNAAHAAVRMLARKLELQRYITDCEGYTSPQKNQ